MSLKPVKVLFFTSLSFWGIEVVSAQNIDRPFENNPYSRYALGEEQNAINPALKAMGSISASYSDPYTINTDNPASYAHIRNVTYEAGGEGRMRTILSGTNRYQTGSAALSYLNIAIPMGKYAGMLIGFRPQTKVGYALYEETQTLLGPTSRSYTGSGSTNHFFIGGAGTFKGLSLGANVGYLFGTIRQASWFKTQSTINNVSNSEFSSISNIGGMYFRGGALYEYAVSKDYILRLGVQADLKQNVGSELNEYWISHPFYASDTSGSDTALAKKGVKEKITLPATYAFGLHFAKGDRWAMGINYKMTNWQQFNNPAVIKDSIGKNAFKLSIGGEYTPNALGLYKYWQRVTYRAGFYYGKDFVSINNLQANYYAATFGVSLPFRRTTDRIHTAFEIGKMGSQAKGTLQQNFIRFSLGVSFNDRSWFIKRKYD